MKKRMVRVLTSAALTAAMVMSMGGMTAFAESEPITSIDIIKQVTTDGNTYAPNETFTFEVTEGTGGNFVDGNQDGATAKAGIPGGLAPAKDFTGIKFDPTTDKTTELTHGEGNQALVIDSSVFESTGIYHYIVTETPGSYDGITYDDKKVNVYLYVYENEAGECYVGNVVINKEGTAEKQDGLLFVNKYGTDETKDTVHDITIEKKVTGSLGEKAKDFEFTITVSGEDGELYKAVKKDKTEDEIEITFESGQPQIVTLMDGETVQIYGISEEDTYTVEETGKNDGYTVSYKIDADEAVENAKIENGKVEKDGTQIVFTNHKDAVTPTGIVMTFAPYVALIGLAGVFAATFLRKRREDF